MGFLVPEATEACTTEVFERGWRMEEVVLIHVLGRISIFDTAFSVYCQSIYTMTFFLRLLTCLWVYFKKKGMF